MKRFLHILAVAAILLTSIHSAMAQNYQDDYLFSSIAPSGDTLFYIIRNDSVWVVAPCAEVHGSRSWDTHIKPTGALIIPDSVSWQGINYAVEGIDADAFFACRGITSVVLPNTLAVIDGYAFFFCTSLYSVTIGESVTDIFNNAFTLCDSLTIVNCLPAIPPTLYLSDVQYYYNEYYGIVQREGSQSDVFYRVTDINTMASDQNGRHFNVPCDTKNAYISSWGTLYPFYEPLDTVFNVLLNANDDSLGSVSALTNIRCADSSVVIYAEAIDSYHFGQWSNGSTANPDTVFLTGDTTITAIFVYDFIAEICMVSVENGHNTVLWNNEQEVGSYNIYREGNIAGEYELLASVPYSSPTVWMDTSSRPTTRSYRYRMTATDLYGHEMNPGVVHKTMHLSINQGLGGRWNLQWTPYEGAEYITYIIYRGTNATDLQQIDIMPADGNTSYSDETAPEGDVYYQVGIVMSTPCSGGTETAMGAKSNSISLSNIATDSAVGISNVENDGIDVYSQNGRIVVRGTTDRVLVYDMVGRQVENQSLRTGVYLLKIGDHPPRKVVVIR